MAEVNSLLEDWKKSGARNQIGQGFCTIMRHWEDGKSSWNTHQHGGHEYIILNKILGLQIDSFSQNIIWKLCSAYFIFIKPIYFTFRLLMWPVRKKSPWNY
jgi:hypothetical protein